ncbi:MAG: NUDIX domain-containing protein [Deltaproteobacteria bacterium]|nr:NUDIX domain-containing protein [Deltaproteobacteria bacterium]
MTEKPYRLGIVAVFQNSAGEVLLFRRRDTQDAWQFPQGGREKDESPVQALYREVTEETGCGDFTIVKGPVGPVTYDFPHHYVMSIAREYRGQSHDWFLCHYDEGKEPDLSQAIDQEFDDWRWAPVTDVVSGLISWKKEAYYKGLQLLSLLS